MSTNQNNATVPVLTPVQAFHALKQELEVWREQNDDLTWRLESVQGECESLTSEVQALREQTERLEVRLDQIEREWLSVETDAA
jgi:predicted  nucleic acid-binding Zn-ribbon protein